MLTRKQNIMKLGLFAMILLPVTLLSFIPKPGADHFEVYLNKKLVFQQYVGQNTTTKSLALDQGNINDQVDVFYSHCGVMGKKRTITIRDGQTILRQWRFPDTENDKAAANRLMSMRAKDILSFQSKGSDRKINLYYSSEQIPDGRLLASIVLDTENTNKAQP